MLSIAEVFFYQLTFHRPDNYHDMLMLRHFFRLLILLIYWPMIAQPSYPTDEAPQAPLAEEHPYLWLEQTNSQRVQQWLGQQERSKEEYFKASDFKKFSHTFTYSAGESEKRTENHTARLEVRGSRPGELRLFSKLHGEKAHVLIDCEDLKYNEYDYPAIDNFWLVEGRHLLVAAVSHAGSDWSDLLVYDLRTLAFKYMLEGVIRPWIHLAKDGSGFYYEQYEVPDDKTTSIRKNQRISFHTFGLSQEEDRVIFQNEDPTHVRYFSFLEPKGSKWLYVFHPFLRKDKWYEAISLINLTDKVSIPRPFAIYGSEVRLTFDFLYEQGNKVYFRTDMRAPTFEVLGFDITQVNQLESIIPPYEEVLSDATLLNSGHWGLTYLGHGNYTGVITDSQGNPKLRIPVEDGAKIEFAPSDDPKTSYFYTTSYHLRSQKYRINLKKMNFEFMSTKANAGKHEFQVEVVNIKNKQGGEIPVHLVYKTKTFNKDGKNPCLLRVYGGYGNIQEPSFSWYYRYFVENGGVLVFPGVRGSGALGTTWAQEGQGALKQNTIDDIVSTAEFLIKKKYTTPDFLFMEGASHGGFAVAAAAIQRPELFKGVIAKAGVYDLLRFTDQTVGSYHLNRLEFGDPSDQEAFAVRKSLSPIHNLKSGVEYPSFLLITGSNDSRVPPSYSYRFLAALQEHSSNGLNFLHVTRGGHYISSHVVEEVKLWSFKFKFLWLHTGYKFWLSP